MPLGSVKEVGERGALVYRVDSQLALFGGGEAVSGLGLNLLLWRAF